MKDEAIPWDCPGFMLPPIARRIGPLPHRHFIEAVWRRRQPTDVALPVQREDAFAPLQIRHRVSGPAVASFAGCADLVDYRSPLGEHDAVATAVAAALDEMPPGTEVVFDSLPEEAAAVLSKAMAGAGMESEPSRHTVAAVLALPGDTDAWLGGLGKKDRHELRRKTRRFEAALGPAILERSTGRGPGLEAFIGLHRRASGAKGRFMDEAMTAFFGGLADGGFQVDLLTADGRPVAGSFAYEDEEGYYLYNSAYEPDAAAASPGVMLLWCLIHRAVESGRAVFDFLKGDETYKFRLGAEPRPLYELRATR
jgi:CelD/BcsL family acetyltransferase involved in cellulose biosynthesis